MKSLLTYLRLMDGKTLSCKLILASVLIFMGFLCFPVMILTFVLVSVFIICERNMGSFLYVLFFMPFMSVFRFENTIGLSFWSLLIVVFVIVNGIRYIVDVTKKEKKINWKLIVPFLVFFVYIAIPLNHKFNLVNVGETAVWLTLFYLLIVYFDEIKLPTYLNALLAGILYSSFIGLFSANFTYFSDLIGVFYIGATHRFSGLMVNPNVYYELMLIALTLIYVLIYNKQIKKTYLLLVLPLTIFGILSISKTFAMALALLMVLILISCVVKFRKDKLLIIGFMFVLVFVAFLLAFTQSQSLFSRVETVQEVATATEAEQQADAILTGRFSIWQLYIEDFTSSWTNLIFGKGLGSATGLIPGTNSHNAYIQFVYELGLLGADIFVRCLISLYRLAKVKFKKDVLKVNIFPLIIVLACFVVENHFFSQVGNILMILALIAFFYKREKIHDNT